MARGRVICSTKAHSRVIDSIPGRPCLVAGWRTDSGKSALHRGERSGSDALCFADHPASGVARLRVPASEPAWFLLPPAYGPLPATTLCSVPVPYAPFPSISFTLSSLRTCRSSPLKQAERKAETSSLASSVPMTRAPRQSTFMSSCSTPCRAEYVS